MAKVSKAELDKLFRLDFTHCNPSSKSGELHEVLVERLIMAQRYAGFQFTITSAYRSQAYERSKGRKGTSSHCRGLAVDVSARDSHTRYKIVLAAAFANIPRIGIGETFIHLDIDETKAHPIIFHYYQPQET